MSRRLVFLGCSLSNEALTSWTKVVADAVKLPYVNFSQPAGNNILQVHLLNNYLLSEDYSKDDIFVWQFTGFSRTNFVCPKKLVLDVSTNLKILDALAANKKIKSFDYVDLPNHFNAELIALLSNPHLTDIRNRIDPYGLQNNEALLMQTVLSTAKLLTASGHKLVTILGWDNVLPEAHRKTFLRELKKFSTHHVHNSILEWCMGKNMEFRDDLHPTDEGSIRWANTNVLPIVQKILAGK